MVIFPWFRLRPTLVAMLSRDSLWRREGGAAFMGLGWLLAGACAVPWLIPETWDGRVPPGLQAAGWALLAATAPLARLRRWIWLPMGLALVWAVLGGLARQ